MSGNHSRKPDRRTPWVSGHFGRFCFISLGIVLHASNEIMRVAPQRSG